MTVAELIEMLKQFPEDLKIVDACHEPLEDAYQATMWVEIYPLKQGEKVVVIC